MKIYRIWEKGAFNSGGFREYYDDTTTWVYSSYEIAKQHLPEHKYGSYYGEYTEYYIKEEEME